MNIQIKSPVTPLRQRMTEDMTARKLGHHSQRSHLYSCKRFAAFLDHSPETATADDIGRFQLFLVESGTGICNRNRIMTGVRFLFRVTLRRHDLAAEIFHLKAPQKVPVTLSQDEIRRLPETSTAFDAAQGLSRKPKAIARAVAAQDQPPCPAIKSP